MIIKNFNLYELVNPILYKELIDAGLVKIEVKDGKLIETYVNPMCENLFFPKMLRDLSQIRNIFGAIEINNWHTFSQWVDIFKTNRYSTINDIKELFYEMFSPLCYDERGIRPHRPATGNPTSTHCFGLALDLFPLKATAEEIRQYIPKNPNKFSIRRLEKDVSWVHLDYLETGSKEIVMFQ